jgi:hypothetical protein
MPVVSDIPVVIGTMVGGTLVAGIMGVTGLRQFIRLTRVRLAISLIHMHTHTVSRSKGDPSHLQPPIPFFGQSLIANTPPSTSLTQRHNVRHIWSGALMSSVSHAIGHTALEGHVIR